MVKKEEAPKQENISSKLVAFVLILSLALLIGGVWVLSRPSGGSTKDTEHSEEESIELPQDPAVGVEQDPGVVKAVSGQVTEVFEDCSRHLILEDGVVIESDEVSCDGGSYIVIDGIIVYTASGFVPENESYSTDLEGLAPGDYAEVTYITTAYSNQINCDECGLEKS